MATFSEARSDILDAHPRLTTGSAWIDGAGEFPIVEGALIRLRVDRLPGGVGSMRCMRTANSSPGAPHLVSPAASRLVDAPPRKVWMLLLQQVADQVGGVSDLGFVMRSHRADAMDAAGPRTPGHLAVILGQHQFGS